MHIYHTCIRQNLAEDFLHLPRFHSWSFCCVVQKFSYEFFSIYIYADIKRTVLWKYYCPVYILWCIINDFLEYLMLSIFSIKISFYAPKIWLWMLFCLELIFDFNHQSNQPLKFGETPFLCLTCTCLAILSLFNFSFHTPVLLAYWYQKALSYWFFPNSMFLEAERFICCWFKA